MVDSKTSSMLDQAKVNCEFANWYPKFSHLTTRTRVLEAPEEFREYLLSDGIALRENSAPGDSNSDDDWETPIMPDVKDEESHSGDDDDENSMKKPPADFHDKIENTIKELNGEVAPKLNWSAPVDSKWMTTSNTMRCTSANDIYLLLKSSDYVNHDLSLNPSKITLVLREWFDLHPSTEFRCFVKDKKLVAITQRDMNYYEFLHKSQNHIIDACVTLSAKIVDTFPDKSFVFDAHIPDNGNNAVLIDINPWNAQTDTLLFTWDQLNDINAATVEKPEIRLVEKVDRSRTFSSKPHSTSYVPYDFVDMDRQNLEDMLRQMKEQRKKEQQKT